MFATIEVAPGVRKKTPNGQSFVLYTDEGQPLFVAAYISGIIVTATRGEKEFEYLLKSVGLPTNNLLTNTVKLPSS